MTPPIHSRRAISTAWTTSLALSLIFVGGGLAVDNISPQGQAHPQASVSPTRSIRKLNVNGLFEQHAAGWQGHRVALKTGKRQRSAGTLRATVKPGSEPATVSRVKPVATSRGNATYHLSAWVRSPRSSKRLCLRLRGVSAKRVVGGSETCLRAGRGWRLVRLSYHPRRGQKLRLALSSEAPRRGDVIEMRSVRVLERVGSRSSPLAGAQKCGANRRRECPTKPVESPAPAPPVPAPSPVPAPTPSATPPPPATAPSGSPLDSIVSSGFHSLLSPGPFGTASPQWSDANAWQADSSVFADRLRSVVTSAVLTVSSYGVAVVVASASDPLVTVTNTNNWGTVTGTTSFRAPAAAKPASGTDGHLVVVQPDGSAIEMWKASRQANGNFTAGAVARSLNGQHGFNTAGCRGSSFALAAGVIDPLEVKAGTINHALLMILPTSVVKRAAVWPSTSTDGTNYSADSLPEGARLILDPNADLSKLTALERAVAVALQRYGAYLGDKTGGTDLSFATLAPESYTTTGQSDQWAAQGITGYPTLNNLLPLLSRMKVQRFSDYKTF